MHRALFIALIFALSVVGEAKAQIDGASRMRAWDDLDHITRGDLNFFFERISFTNGHWQFVFSPNVRGMLWRVKSDNSDITGACDSGQVLNIPARASLEIKRQGTRLFFDPMNEVSFRVYLTLEPEKGVSTEREEREVMMVAWHGGINLHYVED